MRNSHPSKRESQMNPPPRNYTKRAATTTQQMERGVTERMVRERKDLKERAILTAQTRALQVWTRTVLPPLLLKNWKSTCKRLNHTKKQCLKPR